MIDSILEWMKTMYIAFLASEQYKVGLISKDEYIKCLLNAGSDVKRLLAITEQEEE